MIAAGLVALAAAVPSAPARVVTALDEVELRTETSFDSLTVGQRFHVLYRFTYADSLRPVARESLDAGTCRVMSMSWTDAPKGRQIERTGDITFIPLSVDSSVVPANAFDFVTSRGDTIRAWSDEVPVPIRRIAATAKDLRPLKKQWEPPVNWWLWAGIAAALAALLAALAWWIRGRRRRGHAIAPTVHIPPEVAALAELDRIAALGLAQRGEFKAHYTLVVDALRWYLEARYGIEAMDRTSFEIIDALDDRGVRVDGLRPLLDEADLVKFAKFSPDVESAAAVVVRAREMVTATTPIPAAPAGATGASG
jgi:hypothetical protein